MEQKKYVQVSCLFFVTFLISVAANAQWTSVGGTGFSSSIAFNTVLAIDANDTPYVAYRDVSGSGEATVQKYNGSSWGLVGSALFSAGDARSLRLGFGSNDTPYVAYRDAGNSNKVTVMKYNGSSWAVVGSAGFSAGAVSDVSFAFGSNDTPYVAYDDGANSNKATVMKYNGSSWVAVGASGFSQGSVDNMSLTFDNNDTPYVAFRDQANSNGATVMKYNGSSWSVVGSTAFSPSATFYESLAFDSDNTPYVGFSDYANSQRATVMKYTGSTWALIGSAGFSAGGAQDISLVIDSNDIAHIAYADFGNSGKATVMKYNGYKWVPLGSAGFTAGGSASTSLAFNSDNIPYLAYRNDNNSLKAALVRFPVNLWNGSTWSEGTPDSTSYVTITSSTSPSSFDCYDLTIGKSVSLNTGTNNNITVYRDLYNSGNGLSGTGTINFTLNDSAQLGGNIIGHGGTIVVDNGCVLNTNGRLRLTSDASNTGRVGESEGAISGDVYVQRYMPGKRCFRFYGHPFSSSIALSQLTDEIDITGNGGSTNGFTNSISNNPSAFWFDVTTADTSTAGNNPGWTAFTSATSADWDRYELLRLLVRGTKGQGLTGGSYAPSAATFEAVGVINQGNQVITLTKGSSSEFVGCGNPFPSPVNMQNVARGANVGANYYAWDATSGASGAYVTNAWTLSYNLPAYAAFFTTVSANSSNTLTFEEQDKEATGTGLFKGTGPNDWVELYIYDSTTKWDRLLIHLNSNGMEVEDKLDGKKLYNPNLDFFTLSKDDVRLAVDVRPYDDGKSIPLGLTAYNRYNRYVIRTGMFNIPAGTKLMLHDKYLNKQEELKAGSEYWFDVTTDTASQGNNRFEINMVGKPTSIIQAATDQPQVQLIPNPAHKEVKVSFKDIAGSATIKLISITGQVLYSQTTDTHTGSIMIPLHNIPSGIYMVGITGKNISYAEKLIKE